MNMEEFKNLTEEKQIEVKKMFYNSRQGECCDICEFMIDGYCHMCKTWFSNLIYKKIECNKINSNLINFLEDVDIVCIQDGIEEEDFICDLMCDTSDEEDFIDENDNSDEIMYSRKYHNNDYLVEKLLEGKLDDILDEYEKETGGDN